MAKSNENAIKEAAYYIWVNAGMPHGRDEEFWWLAVEQINGGKKVSCSCAAPKKAAPKKVAAKKPIAKKSASSSMNSSVKSPAKPAAKTISF